MTEYSGFKYAIFFLGEYLGMFAVSGLAVTLFPRRLAGAVCFSRVCPESYLWFFAKLSALTFVFIWIRGTLPRTRVDQVMNFAWKFMLPDGVRLHRCRRRLALWAAHGWTGWLYSLDRGRARCAHPLALLGDEEKFAARTYRFAE